MSKFKMVYFCATWCGPCKSMKERIKNHRFLKQLKDKNTDFFVIDIDEYADYAKDCGIDSVPTFILLEDHEDSDDCQIIKKKVGVMSVDQLLNFVDPASEGCV